MSDRRCTVPRSRPRCGRFRQEQRLGAPGEFAQCSMPHPMRQMWHGCSLESSRGTCMLQIVYLRGADQEAGGSADGDG